MRLVRPACGGVNWSAVSEERTAKTPRPQREKTKMGESGSGSRQWEDDYRRECRERRVRISEGFSNPTVETVG